MSDKEPLIIELEIKRAAEHIRSAFMAKEIDAKAIIDEALEQVVKNSREVLMAQARQGVEEAILAEVKSYFGWGDGRKIIKALMEQSMEVMLKNIQEAIKSDESEKLPGRQW